MRYVQFVLLREGTSDEGLVAHLESILVREGADEAVGEVRPYTGSVEEKIRRFMAERSPVDIVFVHRDADRAGYAPREREIFDAARSQFGCPTVIPLVPTTMTETWLLADEDEIRSVAGNPNGHTPLGLGPISSIEQISDAKSKLKQALSAASGRTGRELAQFNRAFSRNRATLLNRLDIDGPVRLLNSWMRLENDVRSYLERAPRSS